MSGRDIRLDTAMAETNVDRSSSTVAARIGKTLTPPARPQLGQLVPEARTGGRPSSPGDASALEPPESSMVAGDSDSSLCGGELTPIRRSRFDVDECPSAAASRRLDEGRRQRQTPRSTQVYTPAPERLHNRSVVYINMLAVSGGTGPGKIKSTWLSEPRPGRNDQARKVVRRRSVKSRAD